MLGGRGSLHGLEVISRGSGNIPCCFMVTNLNLIVLKSHLLPGLENSLPHLTTT